MLRRKRRSIRATQYPATQTDVENVKSSVKGGKKRRA